MSLSYIEAESKEQWLEIRRSGIGGSDVGPICGLSRWKSPIAVFLEKVEGITTELGEAAYWGTVMEPVLANEFTKRTGLQTKPLDRILIHESHEWARANVDRLIISSDGDIGILECKTASEYLYEDWKDERIPDYYMVQLQWYFYVTGATWGYFATLVGGNKFIYYRVERDDAIISLLVDRCSRFWNEYVLTKTMPPFDGSKASSELVKALYPETTPDSIVDLDDQEEDLLPLITQLLHARIAVKLAEEKEQEAENQIKAIMKDREIAYFQGRPLFTWKSQSDTRFDSVEFQKVHPDLYEQFTKTKPIRKFLTKNSIKEVIV